MRFSKEPPVPWFGSFALWRSLLIGICLSGCGDQRDLSSASAADLEEPTFWDTVQPLMAEHCVSCHRTGGIGPFPLETVEQVGRRINQLIEVVETSYMPPWQPEPGDYAWLGDRSLSEAERRVLRRWSDAGMPVGTGRSLPVPETRSGWELGEPDVILSLPEPFQLPAEGRDQVRNFVIPAAHLAGRFVSAIEFDPGVRSVVHHANVLADDTGTARELDRRTSEDGYQGMVGAVAPGGHFLGWTPGKTPRPLEADAAWRVNANTDLVVQLHLQPSGRQEAIQPRLGLHFTAQPPSRRPVTLHLGSSGIDLAAGAASTTVQDEFLVPHEVELVSVYPHAHYRGKSLRLGWLPPSGQKEAILLEITDWDFDWQDEYTYAEPIRLPKGSRLRLEVEFDNSADNPRNPDPEPRRVLWGPESDDEMADIWLKVFPAAPLDGAALRQAAANKDLEISLEGFRVRSELEPHDPQWPLRLALTLLNLGRPAEAQPLIEQAAQRFPNDLSLRYNSGLTQLALGNLERAERLFESVLKSEPSHLSGLNNLAAVHLRRGNPAAAAKLLTDRIDLDRLLPQELDLAFNLALAFARQGDLSSAESTLLACQSSAPDDDRLLNQLGSVRLRQGNVKAAEALFQRARALTPQRTEALRNLASLHAVTGNFAEARSLLATAIDRAPADPTLRALVARTHGEEGNLALAVGSLQETVARWPDNGPLHFDLATWADALGDPEVALHAALRAHQLMPNDSDAAEQAATLLAQAGSFEQALDVANSPSISRPTPSLGLLAVRILLAKGSTAEARSRLEHLLRDHPEARSLPDWDPIYGALFP